MSGLEAQLEAFSAGAENLVSHEELRAKLERGAPLRIKYGCDPSAPDLHLGHTVPLEKLRQLQGLGHTIIFLIGDFTAGIGDPTGRSRTRPPLDRDQIRANAETYTDQVGSILDARRAEIRFNSEWMDAMSSAEMVRLASQQPVARMLERDDFRRRYREGVSISLHEFLYPLVQAYDSVALRADLELGGTDQTFNLLLGREIQRAYGQEPQIVLTLPLLEGTDGAEKMSKSLGNSIGIQEDPEEFFGKVMSIPDSLLGRWIELLAPPEWELDSHLARLDSGGNPRDLKAELARRLLDRFQGQDAADRASEHFDRVFRRKQAPEDIERVEVEAADPDGAEILAILQHAGFAGTRGEGRRLVRQGGVRLDGSRVDDPGRRVRPGEYVLQVGKRRFARVSISPG
ncbi:MAG: tyrosine--tRNA ligase [Proteobacteria bacterium]|nr:tyrosine--tRNA ligase [Pseudomonadota bacterium]